MANIAVSLMIICYLLTQYLNGVVSWGAVCEGGPPGEPGPDGPPGPPGSPGIGELLDYNNWRQCTWNSANNDDYATIYTCSFTKQHADTALYVSYGATMRIYNCHGCCKRWYFTFNDVECSPVTIDGVVYMENTNTMNILRHRNIQGFCHNLGAGSVDVAVKLGDCPGYGNADAQTGWNSVSRIIIKEVPASPYE